MKDHVFYMGLVVVVLVGFAMFAPSNSITGFAAGECENCGKLCETHDECGGVVCCPTNWESGVCHQAESCAAIAELSIRQTYAEYASPETPQSLKNIAWKSFGMPLVFVLVVVFAVIYFARRNH